MSATVTDAELALVCAGVRIKEVCALAEGWLFVRGGGDEALLILDSGLTDRERAYAYEWTMRRAPGESGDSPGRDSRAG